MFPLETAIASAFGSAAGAAAAFTFNLRIESTKRRTNNIIAGHVALAILRSKLLYVQIIAKAWQTGQVNHGPPWWQFPAPRAFPGDPRQIDLESLGFLLAKRKSSVISDVIDAEVMYFDFMIALDDYREFFQQTLHPTMRDAGIPEQLTGIEAIDYERKIPRNIVGRIYDLHGQLAVRVETVPGLMRKAAGNLLLALRDEFPNEHFDSPEPSGRVARANLSPGSSTTTE